jgi:mono/diheme cytochrome c family protein
VNRPISLLVAVALALALGACNSEKLSPEAERGRQIYMSSCTACHSADPAQPGAVGPEIKGASLELLEAKLLKGTYPPGYKPKRPTAVMPPQTQLTGDIPALAAYLR